MTDGIEDFFLTLKNPNYLAMKLLLDLFNKMSISDSVSRKIVENISVLTSYNISFLDSLSEYNYVYSEDDLSSIEFAISRIGTEYLTCHEFGHLLLDIFARGELPENYMEVNTLCIKRLMDRKEDVSRMFNGFVFEATNMLFKDFNKPFEFLERHPEFVRDYYNNNPDADQSFLFTDVVSKYSRQLFVFDRKIDDYNRIGNVIDGMFHGSNPFALDYGNPDFYPVISMHDVDYFLDDSNGKFVAGFEEQFADYLVLRVYGDQMTGAVNTLHNLVGEEWFSMMDKFYETVAERVCEKEKVYQYKN